MREKKIVTIGGGTGQYALLTGLKKYPYDITAIVTMADDGGSTGTLRDELGVLPPGDVRQCLVALSDSTQTLRALMNYRFESGGLKGHNFGNLLLSALEKITGNFSKGIEEATRILTVRGHVIPVSESDMRLRIYLEDGTTRDGESALDENSDIADIGISHVKFVGRVHVNKKAVVAIDNADAIIIGPGDHFGSVLPNLLVAGIARALRKTKAMVIFVAPLTNKRGHTSHFTVDDYICAIEKHIGRGRVDFVMYNTKKPSREALLRYERQEGGQSRVLTKNECDVRTYRIVTGDFLARDHVHRRASDSLAQSRAFIRHDSNRLAEGISFALVYGNDGNVVTIY